MGDKREQGATRKLLMRWGIVAGLLVMGVLATAGIQHRIHYRDAARNAAAYAEDARKDVVAKCVGLVSQARDDCFDEISDAAREQQRNEYDLYSQQAMALWTAVMGGMAVFGVSLSAVGVYLIWQTWSATRIAVETSAKTYQAFVAAEDASLVVEFPTGAMSESAEDGVRQPDTYFFKPVITNIGRSAARIRGWRVRDGPFRLRERTLEAGDTWKCSSNIVFNGPDLKFSFELHYSTPLRERMILEVNASVRSKQQPNGATAYSARVKSARLRQADI